MSNLAEPRAFEDHEDVLEEVELFVAAGGPEVLPVIDQVVLLLIASIVGDLLVREIAPALRRPHCGEKAADRSPP